MGLVSSSGHKVVLQPSHAGISHSKNSEGQQSKTLPAPCPPGEAHWNCSACERALPFSTEFKELIISCCLSPPSLSPWTAHNMPRNVEFIFHFFLPALLSNSRGTSDWFSNTPHPCLQARDKSSYWIHHLDVLTLCGMIYRKAASITISLTPCIDKMLKIQNCQDGTVHRLRLKQLSADSPRHTHTHKKPLCQKQWLNPSVPKKARPGAVFLTLKSGLPTATFLSNRH